MKSFGSGVQKYLQLASALAISLAAGAPAHAQSLVLYDGFTGSLISPANWYSDDGSQYGGIRTEEIRSVVSGQAHMELRTWGNVTSDTNTSSSRSGLVVTNSPAVTSMQAAITMVAQVAYPCSTNTSQISQARARLFGFYFNAGIPRAGSEFNDVFAGAQVYRASNSTDPATTMRVSAFVGICTDDSCIESTQLASLDLGTVTLNSPTNLRVFWDKANSRFSFQRDSNAPVYAPYPFPSPQPASYPAKRMEISNIVAQCTSPSRPSVYTSANFDNVYTNPL